MKVKSLEVMIGLKDSRAMTPCHNYSDLEVINVEVNVEGITSVEVQ